MRVRSTKPESARRYNLRTKYGIASDDYDLMLQRQGGVCAICQRPETGVHRSGKVKRLAVDHDHMTGRVRGLLCFKCNAMLGKAHDDPRMLLRAIEYLAYFHHGERDPAMQIFDLAAYHDGKRLVDYCREAGILGFAEQDDPLRQVA